MSRRASWRAQAAALVLGAALVSCAGFQTPPEQDLAATRARAAVEEHEGVRAAAALLSRAESLAVFGVDLARRSVEPVWLEIENRSGHPLYLVVTAVDPEYFAPLEVGHLFHRGFARAANARVDFHLSRLAFEKRTAIASGETRSGFVYTFAGEGLKVVDIDLVGEGRATSLTLFVPDPDDARSEEHLEVIESRFSAPELVALDDDAAVRSALALLPCCAVDAGGAHVAPLNLVAVGSLDRLAAAFLRRGYRSSDAPPLRAFQRSQDLAARKFARWVEAQPNTVRFWQTPLRWRGEPIWLAQVGSPRGGRFASERGGVVGIDPRADVARDDVVEDLLYSQSVARLGFALGAGCPAGAARGVVTDGLRAVLALEGGRFALDEIGLLDWERPGKARPEDCAGSGLGGRP